MKFSSRTMSHRPTGRINLAVSALLIVTASCSGESPQGVPAELLVDDGSGALRGELVKYIATYDDHSETLHKLRDATGVERLLVFDKVPELEPGDLLKVWGATEAGAEGEQLRVQRFEKLAAPLELRQQKLIGGMARPTRRWAFVMIDTGGGFANNVTKEGITKSLFDVNTPTSIRNYFREVSYGLQDLDGDVLGPFKYTPASACDTNGVVNTIVPMIDPMRNKYNQYLWYFGTSQMGCRWAGLAQLGRATAPAKQSWYNAAAGCVVLVQEPGHNFGMVHSSAMACTKGGAPVSMITGRDPTEACTHDEYGNRFDPMGRGCYHMNGPQKAYQDWLGGCNVVKATTSGTFTIYPLEQACQGVQLLQIPLGNAASAARAMRIGTISAPITSYFIELRSPVGRDAPLMTPRIFVTISTDIRDAKTAGARNWLVDMNPATPNTSRTASNVVLDSALPVGRRYEDPDPAGPKFTVLSADRTKAVIKVELAGSEAMADAPGKGVCQDGLATPTAFTAPGPETCSAAPISAPVGDGGVPPGAPPAGDPTVMAPPDAGASDASAPSGTGGAPGTEPPRSGTGGSSGSGTPPGAAGSGAPSKDPMAAETPAIAGGCSCRADGGGSDTGPGGTLSLLGIAAAALWMRRRRRLG